jgi:hypothetical protein
MDQPDPCSVAGLGWAGRTVPVPVSTPKRLATGGQGRNRFGRGRLPGAGSHPETTGDSRRATKCECLAV